MRQLKGKAKETKKERKERRKDNADSQQKLLTIVLPVIVAVVIGIVAFVIYAVNNKRRVWTICVCVVFNKGIYHYIVITTTNV